MKEFDISISDLPDVEDLDIEQYFGKFEIAIKQYAKWKVEKDAIEFGFFWKVFDLL